MRDLGRCSKPRKTRTSKPDQRRQMRAALRHGMVALVAVGKPVNLEEAKAVKHSGKAKKVFEALLKEVSAGN